MPNRLGPPGAPPPLHFNTTDTPVYCSVAFAGTRATVTVKTLGFCPPTKKPNFPLSDPELASLVQRR